MHIKSERLKDLYGLELKQRRGGFSMSSWQNEKLEAKTSIQLIILKQAEL